MAFEETTNATGVGTTAPVVVALFDDAKDAHLAVTQLRESGFSHSQIGAAFRGDSNSRYADRNVSRATPEGTTRRDGESWWEKIKDAFHPDDRKVEARREIAADPDLDVDPYARSEYEYDFEDRDFESSLAGAGIPSDRAAHLTRNLRSGGAIVTVRDADRAGEAEQILAANRGRVRYEDVDRAETGYPQTAASTIDAADSTGREAIDTGSVDRRSDAVSNAAVDRVQLFGEVLRVHKERISRGEARIRKDVVNESQTFEVPITREELVLERVAVPADTPAPSADIGRGQEVRVPLSEDRVRVEKVPVVTEEVRVGKREVADVARVGEDVRHEELRVDSDLESPRRTVAGEEVAGDLRRRG